MLHDMHWPIEGQEFEMNYRLVGLANGIIAFFVFGRIGKGILRIYKQELFSREMEGIPQGEKE